MLIQNTDIGIIDKEYTIIMHPETKNSALAHPEVQEAKANLAAFLRADGNLTDEGIAVVMRLITIKRRKKGAMLLRAGELMYDSYMVIKGCIRQYYLKDGEERTTFFYTEQDAIPSTLTGTITSPADFYLECVEPSIILALSPENEVELYRQCPILESLCRVDTEKRLVDFQTMMSTYIRLNPEERYLNLLATKPALIHRVPQYQLASYLGVKPESLSRIRKRIMEKQRQK